MIALVNGIWEEVTVLGVGNDTADGYIQVEVWGEASSPPTDPDPDPNPDPDPEPDPDPVPDPSYSDVAFHLPTTSTTFRPVLESSGGAIEWVNPFTNTVASTSLTPELSGSVVWLLRGDVDQITTVNLGFNSGEDSGRYNLGPGYNKHPREAVTKVENPNLMTGLVNFLAACPTLTGHLNFSGCSSLEFVECYLAQVSSVDLTGCTSMIRLCFEQNNLNYLDITPCRLTLRDLRGAAQARGPVTFRCEGDLPQLYHYCTRGNGNAIHIDISQMPVVEQWWVWRTNMQEIGTPTSTIMNSPRAYDNAFTQQSVDDFLVWMDTNFTRTSGNMRIDGGTSAAPSAVGIAAANNLRARGIAVSHN